jgi:hypothetical protein
MRSKNLLAIATGLASMTVVLAPQVANACAVCGLGPNDVGGHAFNSSVLFMMAVPYATVILVGGIFFWTWRKAAVRRADSTLTSTQKY